MEHKVVFITGCSSGIGKALSCEFHNRGYRVIATARNLDSLIDLRKMGIITYPLDVTKFDQMKQIVSDVIRQEKRIDVLVNNAGYALIGPAIELPREELIGQFNTNVFAPIFLAKEVAPQMREHGGGLIVNMGSISGIATTPFSGAYCSSKAALHAISDALRLELDIFNIKVVTVQPGAIESHFGNAAKKTIARVLKKDSWYRSVEDSIIARAELSQVNATPSTIFAIKLVSALMVNNPPAIIRLGKKSTTLPLLKAMLPTGTLDSILKRKFGIIKNRMRSTED